MTLLSKTWPQNSKLSQVEQLDEDDKANGFQCQEVLNCPSRTALSTLLRTLTWEARFHLHQHHGGQHRSIECTIDTSPHYKAATKFQSTYLASLLCGTFAPNGSSQSEASITCILLMNVGEWIENRLLRYELGEDQNGHHGSCWYTIDSESAGGVIRRKQKPSDSWKRQSSSSTSFPLAPIVTYQCVFLSGSSLAAVKSPSCFPSWRQHESAS